MLTVQILITSLITAALFIIPILAKNRHLSESDKRKAIDYLPTALYYEWKNKMPVLSNIKMGNLAFLIMKKPFRSIDELLETVRTEGTKYHTSDNTFQGSDEESIIIEKNGRVYLFSTRHFSDNGKNGRVVTANDITELYNTTAILDSKNAELTELNNRIKEMIKNAAIYKKEQEMQNTKMRIHGDFAECIYLTKRYIEEEQHDTKKEQELLNMWYNLTSENVKSEGTNEMCEKEFEELFRIADTARCKIIISGELPMTEYGHQLIVIIREALINSIRHANATKLFIDAKNFKTDKMIIISDNGYSTQNSDLKPAGGLLSVIKQLEKSGIVVTIDMEDGYKLLLNFPKKAKKGTRSK